MENSKMLLFERMITTNPDFKLNLNESENKVLYQKKINERLNTGLSSIFLEYNKLSGNLGQDVKLLKEFIEASEEEGEDFDPMAHLEKNELIDEKRDCFLNIRPFNSKLDQPFMSLPVGYTCKFAGKCKTFVDRNRKPNPKTGKLTKSMGDFTCYAGNAEARHPHVQKSRWANKDLLDKFDEKGKVDLILRSLDYHEKRNKKIEVFRIHEAGDFYSLEYFDAWLEVARQRPDILFYAYTKSLPFWLKRKKDIPKNMKLIASYGGKFDDEIKANDLKSAIVVNSPEEAAKLRLPIDIDDTLAYNSDQSFALLLHGNQSKESGLQPQVIKNRKFMSKYDKYKKKNR